MGADADLEGLSRSSRGVGAISAQLREAIEAGTYNKGDQLPPERELALTFRAARSTVRRALDQLQRAGLVSRKLGSGTFVTASSTTSPSVGDVSEVISPLQLIDARCAVEPFTVRLAVLHATRRDLNDMETVLARAEGCNNDKDEFTRWDSEFHLLIARSSRNPLVLIFYRQINVVRLHAQWDAMKEKILTPEVIAEYHVQHRGIFQAIDQRDAQLAEMLITQHLAKARDDLLRANSP